MRKVSLLLSCLFLMFSAVPAMAQAEAKHVHISLIPENTVATPGASMTMLIAMTIDPEWHTYWVNPGDSGAAPRIKWTLPEGFTAGDIEWPTPHPITLEGIVSYGYENQVTLGQAIIAPEKMPEGKLNLQADIEILVCKDICIPENHSVTVAINDPAAQATDNGAAVDAFYKTLPMKTEWAGTYAIEGEDFVARITNPNAATLDGAKVDSFILMPVEWGMVKNAAKTRAEIASPDNIVLRQTHDDRDLSKVADFIAVVSFERADGIRLAQSVTLKPAAPAASAAPDAAAVKAADPGSKKNSEATRVTLIGAIALALMGGLILNLMPCVFPVLSIKALSLVKLREKGWGAAAGSGLAYTLGVLASFAAIGGALMSIKLAGGDAGWGFQLQNPAIVLALAYLLFVIGLNLSGLFDIAGSFTGIGAGLVTRRGWSGSFFTGVLAALVATPCTAPFMAGALGYALVQPPAVAMAVFLALGLGLALPYLILALVPALTALLPRPGLWMVKFREVLAFPMYGWAAWLVWIFTQQTGADGVLWILTGLVAIAFGLWLLAHRPRGRARRAAIIIIALAAFAYAALPFAQRPWHDLNTATSSPQSSVSFTPEALDSLLKGDDPVFVYMTAAWCITCKVNEKVAINTPATQKLFGDRKVTVMEGDWTNMNKDITAYLKSYGRSGVPLYVFYGGRKEGQRPDPIILPQLLTPALIKQTIGD